MWSCKSCVLLFLFFVIDVVMQESCTTVQAELHGAVQVVAACVCVLWAGKVLFEDDSYVKCVYL